MPPPAEWPAIFYAPHQDDEAIGMGGAIAEHKDAGRPVYLVLLSDGSPSSGMLEILNGQKKCSIHGVKHDFGLTTDQMIWARTVEFMASARALGVDRVFLAGGGGFSDADAAADPDSYRGLVRKTILEFEGRYPGASHKLISGEHDLHPNGEGNVVHRACWEAAHELRSTITDFRFYRVYIYDHPKADRDAPHKRVLTYAWRERKRAALSEYRRYEPGAGRYAFGYHSVHSLIDEAWNDDTEYVDHLD